MMRWDLLNLLIDTKGFQKYLEIGIDKYDNFDKVRCPYKIGVDPVYDNHMQPNGGFIVGTTSDLFFQQNQDIFDLVFVDGLHLYEQAAKDIVNSWNTLKVGGFIVIHDCIPLSKIMADRSMETARKAGSNWNGDVFRAIKWFKDTYPDVLLKILFIDNGLGIIHKQDNRVLPPPGDLQEYLKYDFPWLQDHYYEMGVVKGVWIDAYLTEKTQ